MSWLAFPLTVAGIIVLAFAGALLGGWIASGGMTNRRGRR